MVESDRYYDLIPIGVLLCADKNVQSYVGAFSAHKMTLIESSISSVNC